VRSQQCFLLRQAFNLSLLAFTSGSHLLLAFTFWLSLLAFTSDFSFLPNCFTLCLERTRFFSHRFQVESAPLAKLLTNSKMTLSMTESVQVEDCQEEPGISTQDNDDQCAQ
jgi:hypothetical protein